MCHIQLATKNEDKPVDVINPRQVLEHGRCISSKDYIPDNRGKLKKEKMA